jgi:hypothetical protein
MANCVHVLSRYQLSICHCIVSLSCPLNLDLNDGCHVIFVVCFFALFFIYFYVSVSLYRCLRKWCITLLPYRVPVSVPQ